jgi:pyridoxal phosphate enzyme (YggS family)
VGRLVTESIAANVGRVRARIAAAAGRSGRAPETVTIVAVSKTFPIDACREAVDAGIGDLGENRVQELAQKVQHLRDVRWHFVGHLQTNKVRSVVGAVELIHSVDRLRLAETIDHGARALGIIQNVLIQVNVSGETAKHGVDPKDALALIRDLRTLEGLRVVGLMTMTPLPDTSEDSRDYFRRLASLGRDIRAVVPEASHLSMGMTRDFGVAVEEGATIVRVGEAIFGQRTRR